MANSQVKHELAIVHEHRVLFSHHSVGRNLISGLQRLSSAAGIPLKVMSFDQAKAEAGPGLIEISGGENQHPKSKLDYFAETIRAQSLKPELAFMKFCYVDFNPSTDVDALFEQYRKTLDALKQQYPAIKFAHVTVPLITQPRSMKEQLKRMLGRQVWEDTANVKRHEFNQRLLDTYTADPVFDLARAESTRPDGSRETFEYDGRVYYHLVPAYTDDDGHLNVAGQQAVAPELLHFIAAALKPSAKSPS